MKIFNYFRRKTKTGSQYDRLFQNLIQYYVALGRASMWIQR